MTSTVTVKQAERKVLGAPFLDGLWDILIGSVVLMFAIAPLLSDRLGDFWSSMIFLPFWACLFLGMKLVKQHIVAPRLGQARLGRAMKARMARLTLALALLNAGALALGVLALLNVAGLPSWMHPLRFGAIALIGFSLAAYALAIPRFYAYGLLVGLAPAAGEWLAIYRGAVHHGFPIAFGMASGVIALTGLILFVRFLWLYRAPAGEDGGV